MKLIYKLFHQDPESRDGVISVTSGLGIFANILISLIKIIVGIAASSIAIISEGANNAADALSSVLTIVGTKLAGKHPDKAHPFGYRRIEYLTGLVISVMILVAGIEMLISSVKLIFSPEELNVSYISTIIVAVSAVIKFFLGVYTIRKGKETGSSALEAVGLDCRNDSFASVVSIVSALIFLIFGLSLDAYAGVIVSALILKAGIEILRDTVSELIGRSGEQELAEKIYEEINNTDGILNAADMMLHNYGPDTWSG
ncbi:MAG: cation diffusion facilitator family transporter, partial [Oscillospiraceae bacterium]|nr:cation diffusion facilitator family transporter [Oscillospiraceae bacterium]